MDNVVKRIDFVDIAKAIAIFLVVFGHMIPPGTPEKTMVYSFHMPLFFLLSGFFMKKGNDIKFRTLLYKKWHALMVPFLVWGSIYSEFNFKNLLQICYGTRETLMMANSLSSLWFLPVMYLAFIYNIAVDKLCTNSRISKTLNSSFLIIITFMFIGFAIPHPHRYGLPFGADIAFCAAAFMKLGQLLKSNVSLLLKQDKLVLIIVLIGLIFLFAYTYRYSVYSKSVKHILMANAMYGNPFYFLVNAMIGSSIIVVFAVLLDKFNVSKSCLQKIGRNSLGIFLIHKPIIHLFKKVCYQDFWESNGTIGIFVLSITVLMISMLIIKIINKLLPSLLSR